MAIDNMQGKVTTTGMMDNQPTMPRGRVNPQLPTPEPQPMPTAQPMAADQQMTQEGAEEMSPIEQEIVKRANSLTAEDKENFINILSPSVVGTLSKLLPEFADTMEELSSGEPNVIFPLSTIQRYAQSKYGGDTNQALQTFVSDVIKPDYDAFKQQLDTQQTNVPPSQPMQPTGLMTSPQNMETV